MVKTFNVTTKDIYVNNLLVQYLDLGGINYTSFTYSNGTTVYKITCNDKQFKSINKILGG